VAMMNLLVTGKLERGALYSASTFADSLGVSRTSIREALLELSAEGYLVAHDGKGFRVKDLSEKEIRDFFETRRIIELYVIERVIAAQPVGCLNELRAQQRRMEENFAAGDKSAFLDADKAFHLHLIHCHQNRHLTTVMNNIRDLISILGHEAIVREGRAEKVLAEHQAVLDAIASGDPVRAVDAMRIHLEATENFLLAHLSPPSGRLEP
jgi:DNA-binding GntR family transcriptional regulator